MYTQEQQRTLYNGLEKLNECRQLLNYQMYAVDRDNSDGFKKCREICDMICKIQDKL